MQRNYGVPQARRRYVLHAVRKDINNELKTYGFVFALPIATHNKNGTDGLKSWKTVRDAIGDLPPIKAGNFIKVMLIFIITNVLLFQILI